MALGRSRTGRGHGGLDAWPGYVDALSTLLMVIIFVLLVFVLAQGFLSFSLSSRDQALARLNQQVTELAEILALERGQGADLQQRFGRAAEELRVAVGGRDRLAGELREAREEVDRLRTERDQVRAEQSRIAARMADIGLLERGAGARIAGLETQIAEAQRRAEAAAADAARNAAQVTDSARQAAAERVARQQAEARMGAAEQAATAARTAEAALRQETAALARQVLTARAALDSETSRRAQAEQRAASIDQSRQRANAQAEEATAKIVFFERQVAEVRAQLNRIVAALDAAEASSRDKDTQIAALGNRLNAALAAKVEELQRYRSDFFGRLRDVLGERPDVRIAGDRFVLQSEVLFPPGSSEMSDRGLQQIRTVAKLVQEIGAQIPPGIDWMLRVDGHADRTPIRTARFGSNWELSAARAIAVAQRLVAEGVPAARVAATAFGDNQPLDPGDSLEALARNRRIELRLTDR